MSKLLRSATLLGPGIHLVVSVHDRKPQDPKLISSRDCYQTFSRRQREKALEGKSRLGVALHQQQKSQAAEEVLRQAVEERGKVLGKEHASGGLL